MRLIGSIGNELDAKRFSRFLKSVEIENTVEVSFPSQGETLSYQIWIHEEEKIEKGSALLQEFLQNPLDSRYDVPEPASPSPLVPEGGPIPKEPKRFKTHFTHFAILLCALLFFLNFLEINELKKMGFQEKNVPLTPLMALFIYDLPPSFEKLSQLVEKYAIKDVKNLPDPLRQEAKRVSEEPYWKGLYFLALAKIKKEDPSSGKGPLFVQIRKGEIWRLVTPTFLHWDLLHILFNMLWLWYLGRPVEERIGFFRTGAFTLFAAIGTNTLQYLMSGPFFLGYSGVITALAGFIWMREKKAPWEGYPLSRSTLVFLLIFVLVIFGIQGVSFFMQIFSDSDFNPNIANTAHISGALIGAFLGRLSYFSQKMGLRRKA